MNKLGHLAQIHAQHVVQHQHLPGRAHAGANANGRAMRQGLRQAGRQGGRHHLQHEHGRPGVLQGVCVTFERGGGFIRLALHPVTAQRVNGLRRQAQVGAHGNAALHQEMHHLGGPAATFELDHVRARLHQRDSAAQGLLL